MERELKNKLLKKVAGIFCSLGLGFELLVVDVDENMCSAVTNVDTVADKFNCLVTVIKSSHDCVEDKKLKKCDCSTCKSAIELINKIYNIYSEDFKNFEDYLVNHK